jgi:hypothetical protein
LIGGFAESRYLQQRILKSLRFRTLSLRRPDTSWTAVVRGAALCGVEKRNIQSLTKIRHCRESYGIAVDQSFSNVLHNTDNIHIQPLTQRTIAKEQLIWLLDKGDAIFSGPRRTVEISFKLFFTAKQTKGKLKIYSCSDDNHRRPENITDRNQSKRFPKLES